MDITNDPRFFTDNVINYRLAAFGSCGVISGIMVDCAMADIFNMDKSMNPRHWIGAIQLVSFFLLAWVLFFNLTATYVSVAQPYHCYRLMTSGNTGFEMAASYYLNTNIATWRHFSIKMMMVSIPLYIIVMGLRTLVHFDRENRIDPDKPPVAPIWAGYEGIMFGVVTITCGVVLFCVHLTHFAVFKERYNMLKHPHHSALQTYVQSLSNPRVTSGRADRELDKGGQAWLYAGDV
jgi:hypothetical protein